MARPPRWRSGGTVDGISTVTLSSWKYFSDYISQVLLDYRAYIFRGHAASKWKLESTLDRLLKKMPTSKRAAARNSHLANFKLAARGRRGSNPSVFESEDDWWSLGQHHGIGYTAPRLHGVSVRCSLFCISRGRN